MMTNILRDCRLGFKLLGKGKGFTFAVLLTLGLCIGGNIAMFTLLNTLVLRPLPVPEPERLIEVYPTYPKLGQNRALSNHNLYLDYAKSVDAFENVMIYERRDDVSIVNDKGPVRAHGLLVSYEFFDVLGIQPFMGSFFREEHSVEGQHRVMVISHSFWKNTFRSDPEIIGKKVKTHDITNEIIGIAPPAIDSLFPEEKIFVPWAVVKEDEPWRRRYSYATLVGRLRPDATIAQVKVQVDAADKIFYEGASAEIKAYWDRTGCVAGVSSYQELRTRDVRPILYLLQGVVLFVLVIGAVNIINLLLARSNARNAELTVRRALGASRVAIAQQLLMENLVLALGGGIVGLAIGWGGLQLINRFALDMLGTTVPFGLNGPTLFFAFFLSLGMGFLLGVLPILKVFRGNVQQSIHLNSRGASVSKRSRMISSFLVSGQVGLALVLLIGAGLLLHSFYKVSQVDSGFDPKDVLITNLNLGKEQDYDTIHAFQQRLRHSLMQIPGVESLSMVPNVPQIRSKPSQEVTGQVPFRIRGNEMDRGGEVATAHLIRISPDYFKTLNIPILEGRDYNESDREDVHSRVIIDKRMADKYFPGQNPVGKYLTRSSLSAGAETHWKRIIGVVGTVQYQSMDETDNLPFMYRLGYEGWPFHGFSLLVKSQRPFTDLFPLVRQCVHEINPDIPLFMSGELSSFIGNSLNGRKAILFLLVIFAGIALTLSFIGIFGVLAYDVSQRVREIGIRRALGATKNNIIILIIRQGIVKTSVGLIGGLIGAYFLSQLMVSLLFEVTPTDPIVFVVVPLALLAVAFWASYLPAKRAALIQPMTALRYE